jgi:hypothetical protein
MENWKKQLIDRLPSKAPEEPVKSAQKKLESKEVKDDESIAVHGWDYSSDGGLNEEDDHQTRLEDDI